MKRRLLSFVLAFAMLLSVTPVAVFATGSTFVAEVGEGSYKTLAAAIDKAEDGDTIKLLADVNEAVTFGQDITVTLDLNGNTVSSGGDTITVTAGEVIITDSGDGSGMVTSTSTDNYTGPLYVRGGNVTLKKGTLSGAASGVYIGAGNFTMEDGIVEYTTAGDWHVGIMVWNATSNLTIKGGTVRWGEGLTNGWAIYCCEGQMNIDGGSFYGPVFLYTGNGATGGITGGTFYDHEQFLSAVAEGYAAEGDITNGYVILEIVEKEIFGEGTETEPYQIKTPQDLMALAYNVNYGIYTDYIYVELVNDIDMAGIAWTPIGASYVNSRPLIKVPFIGSFEGNNKTISNLHVSAVNGSGLFGATQGAVISNLKIDRPTGKLGNASGTVVGYGAIGANELVLKMTNVHVTNANLTGYGTYIGGLVGHSYGASMTNCSFSGALDAPGSAQVAGLLGSGGLTATGCSVNATITAWAAVGGMVGNAQENTSIKNSAITGTFEATGYGIGAAIGLANSAKEVSDNTFTNVSVQSPSSVGSIIGAESKEVATVSGNTLTNVTVNGAPSSAVNTIGDRYGVAAMIGNTEYDSLQNAIDAAEAANTKDIVIDLVNDATLDITAWQTLAIGGADTETITINGNGHTLVFNKKDSDWNHVITNNAKLILNNMTLADSGYNDGPWNRYDINFACDVELNNVVSNKALAFKADATLNNVTVNESGDNYAIWIQADGQTVVANGLTVNAENGRGIKIDEQYVTNAAKVDLTVTNAEFTTAKKAAILVKTAGGADISVANVDISKVAADPINVVWVDEDSADNFNDVTVNGGRPVIESANGAIEGLNYVSLGDSMSNGYGLDGYDANNGVEDYGDKSYANQFATWLAQNNDAVVNHAQLAMSAMRAEDLHWLLEVNYNDPAVIHVINTLASDYRYYRDNIEAFEALWNSVFTNGDYWTWKELVNDYRFDIAAAYIENLDYPCIREGENMTGAEKEAIYAHYDDVGALQVVAEYYQTSVKNADVISLGMGNGNFGVFMFGRIMEAIGFGGGEPADALIYDVERAIAECPANVQHEILVLKDQLYAKVESMVGPIEDNPTLEALANTAVYTGLSYVLNYAGSVEAILQRNPDAEIILVALMNTFNDPAQASRAIPGVADATLGDLLNVVFTPLNAYIAALPTYMQATGNSVYANATFYHAEADRVECLVEVYGDEIDTNETIRDRFVTDIVGTAGDPGMVWGLLAGVELVDGVSLIPVTLEEVCDYVGLDDAGKAAYAAQNTEKAVSIAVYLAFEDAIINAAAGAPVSIASVLNLGSIMSGGMNVFGGVMDSFEANIGTNASAYGPTAIAVATDLAAQALADGINQAMGATVLNKENAKALIQAPDLSAALAGASLAAYEAQIAPHVDAAKAGINSSAPMLSMLLALPETLSAAVQNDPSLQGLLGLFARCVIGNGLGAHPSATGHNQLAAAVINAYENGFTAEDQTKENLKVVISDAYAQAYQYALANGYIDMAKGYIGIASGAISAANTYVSTLEVPAQLLNTKALLLEEIGKTQVTLAKINALLNINELTPETWAQILAMEEEIYAHMATLEDLAAELGVVGNIAMDQIGVVANYYAGMIDAIANNAYAWVANGVQEFNAEYAAWVESVGLMADKIDPELGAAVRAYLTETPAEALAIMYAAGDDAVVEFIAATAAASDDIKVIVTAISAILDSDITAIANAVKNSNEVAAIMAQIDAVKNQIAATVDEMMNYPVSSALAYQKIINQLKGQLAILQGQLVDAILNSVDDVDPTLRPLLNKALNALKDAVRVAANYGAEYGAWFDARFDEMLGDLLALLIDNTNEFGSIAGPILGETIDNFLHYVGNMAYQKGVEILDKVENEVIPAFIDTLKDYGAQAWAQLVAKLDALGLLDAVDQAQKDLNNLYELINSYITDDLAGAYDTLLDRMAELKDNVVNLIETVGNELANTSEEEIRATLAALQEKLENLYNAILALENVVNEAIHGNINTAIAMAQVALNNVAAAVADLAGVLSEDAAAAVTDLANDVKAMLNEAYVDAITDTYTVAPDSYYVAMGDSSVFGENTYAQKLAAELGLTTSQFINLSAAGMSVAETIGLVNANASEIAKADLITIGYSNNTMMEFVIAQLKAATDNGEAQPMDWTALVGEKLVPHVEKALADITADMLASGVDAQYAELLSVAVEAYAYAAVSHALNYPTVVGSIHEINPDALVVIVGMYNPLAGVSVRLSSTETIEIGDYVQKLIDLANMETLAYAMLAPNTIYVDAPNVTTQAQPGEIPVVNFLMGLLMNGTDKYYATEDGHAYIAQQILNALTVTKSGLLGDANNDGKVSLVDAVLVLDYCIHAIVADRINVAVADVSGDGKVSLADAVMILDYSIKAIDRFPAEISNS